VQKLFITLATMLVFTGSAHAIVNINTATQAELQTIPSISAARAKAIIEYRTKAGAFRSTDDLLKVDDQLDLRTLRKDVTISGPTRIDKEVKPVAH
jgi:competence protein ComEA